MTSDENALYMTSDENALYMTSDENALYMTSDENALYMASDENAVYMTSDENAGIIMKLTFSCCNADCIFAIAIILSGLSGKKYAHQVFASSPAATALLKTKSFPAN